MKNALAFEAVKERERLVRSWIAPHGGSVHLDIGGKQVLAAASDILENRWYHICLSWESQAGRYGLWIDGRLSARGHSVEVRSIEFLPPPPLPSPPNVSI